MRPLVVILTEYPDVYECDRFREEAQSAGVRLEVLRPAEWRDDIAPDVVVPRTGAETTSHARMIMHWLQQRDVPFVNSAAAVSLAGDKLESNERLRIAGMPVAATVDATSAELGEMDPTLVMAGMLGPPVVLKPRRGSRGRGVRVIASAQELASALEEADEELVLQEYVPEAAGRDWRVLVVGGRILGAVSRVAPPGEMRANFHLGAEVTEIVLPPELDEVSLGAAEALGLDVAGIDLVESARGPVVLEVNSAPGFRGFEAATGVDVASEVLALARRVAGG